MALDLSYIIPIFCRRVYHNHPEVMFKPGPFYMGSGWLGLICNCICITWTLFMCALFSLPTNLPVTTLNMNYASVSSCLLSTTISLIFSQGNYRWSYCLGLVSCRIYLTDHFDAHNCWHSLWYFAAAHKYYTGPKSNLKGVAKRSSQAQLAAKEKS